MYVYIAKTGEYKTIVKFVAKQRKVGRYSVFYARIGGAEHYVLSSFLHTITFGKNLQKKPCRIRQGESHHHAVYRSVYSFNLVEHFWNDFQDF